MEIPPRFGYQLATEQNINNGAVAWANNTAMRYHFRFSPRYSLPLAGLAVYISTTSSGTIDGFLHPTYQDPLRYHVLSPAGIDRFNLPSSPGRFVISDLHYNLQQALRITR